MANRVSNILKNKRVRIVVSAVTAAGVGFLIAGGSSVESITSLVSVVGVAVVAVINVIGAILSTN